MAADVATSLKNWSTDESQNSPSGSTAISTNLDDNIRMLQAVTRAAIAASTTIASATTTDIGTKDEGFITVTGTTTITGLGTVSAGIAKWLIFSGALTFTYNATSLILPGSANITTAAGDAALMLSLGSGNWRCLSYMRANGQVIAGSVLFGDGTVSAPGISFLSDADNGFYRIGANNWAASTAGTKVLDFSATRLDILQDVRIDNTLSLWKASSSITATDDVSDHNNNQWLALSKTVGSYTPNITGDASGNTVTFTGTSGTTAGGHISLMGGAASAPGDSGNVEIGVYGIGAGTRMEGATGHWHEVETLAGPPTISSGGGTGASITGTDNFFRINLGSSPGSTAVVVDFANTWAAAPMAIAQYQNSHIAVRCGTSTTQITITPEASMASSGGIIDVICRGREAT